MAKRNQWATRVRRHYVDVRFGCPDPRPGHGAEVDPVRAFQRGSLFYVGRVDGVWGPMTEEAAAWLPSLSLHSSSSEWADHGTGLCWVQAPMVTAFERYRQLVRHPVTIISGCRTVERNAQVGGAPGSYHTVGLAVDVTGELTPKRLREAVDGVRGIGVNRAHGLVVHFDLGRSTRDWVEG